MVKEKPDYIDRAHYCKHICKCNRDKCDRAACPIWNAPSADVVEVVRCRDCKYFTIDEGDVLGFCHCERIVVSGMGELYPAEEHFCNYGERKEQT